MRLPRTPTQRDGVDFFVERSDGDLGAVAGLAGQRPNLNNFFGYFRDLLFKEPANEIRVSP